MLESRDERVLAIVSPGSHAEDEATRGSLLAGALLHAARWRADVVVIGAGAPAGDVEAFVHRGHLPKRGGWPARSPSSTRSSCRPACSISAARSPSRSSG